MPILWILGFGLLGTAIGSFLNVVCDRAPQRGSLLHPGSHCPSCGRRLEPRELVPVISYLALRGRCRSCQATIPPRVFWVELATGVVFAWLAWYRGPSLELLADATYAAFLVVITVIDLEHKLILNRVIFPAVLSAGVLALVRYALNQPRYLHTGYWLAAGWAASRSPAALGLLSQLTGAVVALAIFATIYLIAPSGMGDGDVRLAAFAGLVTGFPGALAAVFGSFILGGIVAALLLITGRATRRTALPFAPFLVLTTWAINLWGDGWLLRYLYG